MKAFIGRDFDKKYNSLVDNIVTHIEAHDIECVDARKTKSELVDKKVTDLIRECHIFVGIFTRDKTFLNGDGLLKRIFSRKSVQYSTSTWVIQESGFALGTGKELILLIEKGVADFPQLHGNIEYISFDRETIQNEFTRLSQIIGSIKTKRTEEVEEMITEESKQEKTTIPEEKEIKQKEEGEDKSNVVINKIYNALFGREDYKEAQRILDEEAEAVLDDDDKLSWNAYVLRLSPPLGDKKAFEKLQKLVQENKDNPRVIKQLAHCYKDMREFKKAKEQFLLAAEKYDVNDPEKKSELVDAHVQAAWCLADDDLSGALSMLQKLLFNPNFQDSKAKIYKGMANISKDKDDIERLFIYAEAALDVDPLDTDLRFTLAYAYSQNKDEKLSLLHYKKLTSTTINHTALNNLGAQYNALKLSYKCVQSYYKSADHNHTLAMANLAQKYLNEGFIKDARELVERANKLSNEGVKIDYRVGKAQERINDLLEYEDKKEKEILLEAEKERKFRVGYSKAFCSESTITQNNIEGIWETKWGNFELKFDENTRSFSIEGNVRVEDTWASIAASFISDGKKQENVFKDRNVRITGTIENMSGMYSIEVEDNKDSTILTGEKVHESKGYMIINEDCNCIEIMEKIKDDKTEFKQWKKHEEKAG